MIFRNSSTPSRRRAAWAATVSLFAAIQGNPAAVVARPGAATDTLPDYVPRQIVTGVLRSSGNDAMAPLLHAWQAGFKKFHPEVSFAGTLRGSAGGIYGLEMRTADIALMGRAINPFERYGTYERSWTYPVEIEVASGSYATPDRTPALAILVHRDNPLAKLTLKQLDGIFGAERGGGWKALTWDDAGARTARDNIRTWGQLGVKGPRARRPIHVYGPPLQGAGVITYFQSRVLGGADIVNEGLREYADPRQLLAELAKDPDGIAYAPLIDVPSVLKALPLADKGVPYVPITPATVADRSYPLARAVYIDYTIDNEKTEIANPRVDPLVKEFLRFVLSRQGQDAVAGDGAYLPLPPAIVRKQLEKLDSEAPPFERSLLAD